MIRRGGHHGQQSPAPDVDRQSPSQPIRESGILVVFALIVAAGAKGAFEISNSTMMMNIASVGAWVMLCLGLAYAGVRSPGRRGCAGRGVGLGVLLVVIFGGMQMFG